MLTFSGQVRAGWGRRQARQRLDPPDSRLLVTVCPALGVLLAPQGMGNLVNGCVILICMAMFGLTGAKLDPIGSRNVIMIQFAVGAAVSLFMVVWRYFKLKESKVGCCAASMHAAGRVLSCCNSPACLCGCLQVWTCEKADFEDLTESEVHKSKRYMTLNAFANYWPRLVATCMAWVANVSVWLGAEQLNAALPGAVAVLCCAACNCLLVPA